MPTACCVFNNKDAACLPAWPVVYCMLCVSAGSPAHQRCLACLIRICVCSEASGQVTAQGQPTARLICGLNSIFKQLELVRTTATEVKHARTLKPRGALPARDGLAVQTQPDARLQNGSHLTVCTLATAHTSHQSVAASDRPLQWGQSAPPPRRSGLSDQIFSLRKHQAWGQSAPLGFQ